MEQSGASWIIRLRWMIPNDPIFLFDIQDPKFAVELKIDVYKLRYISILLFNIQEPKSAMEVKIDSYKSRHISIFVFDL